MIWRSINPSAAQTGVGNRSYWLIDKEDPCTTSVTLPTSLASPTLCGEIFLLDK